MKQILMVEDDTTLNKMLSNILLAEGYKVTSACTVAEACQCLQQAIYDLVVLDINLPDGSGYEVCKISKEKAQTPVIFLTANDLEQDMIKGYELGAADYITKPFPNSVLRHKVKAIFAMLESAQKEPSHKIYDDGQLMIDFSSVRATFNGEEIVFAPLEYRMLEVFTRNQKILLTRQKLLESLWDSQENYVDEHTLTAAVSRIRGKIEKGGRKYIQTVYGWGICLQVEIQYEKSFLADWRRCFEHNACPVQWSFFPHAKYRRRFRLCDNGGGLGRVGIYFCPCCA